MLAAVEIRMAAKTRFARPQFIKWVQLLGRSLRFTKRESIALKTDFGSI